MGKNTKLIMSAILVVGIATGIFIMAKPQKPKIVPVVKVAPDSNTNNAANNLTPSSSNTIGDVNAVKSSKYKNGIYSVTASYDSPAGSEDIGVSVTLKSDVIVDSSVTPMAGDGRSQKYQQAFIGGYKPYVIGKNIDSVNLDVVSGASLTPIGFNDALAAIKAKAQN